MNILYVSDLDGTLLNKKKEVTETTKKILNACIEEGMNFSIATARMPYGCDYKLDGIALNTPGIVTNGVFLYDFSSQKYIHVEYIPEKAAGEVINLIREAGTTCFVYTFKDEKINVYYEDKKLQEQTQYYSARALECCGKVECVESLDDIDKSEGTVYLALTGEDEQLKPLLEKLDKVQGIHYAYYLNIYNGLYCLEIFGENASKQNALKLLKKMGGYDEIVVFGDNLNDLSMIEIADRSYAPGNALEDIKKKVTAVLDDCDHNGVALFLEKEILFKRE